LAHNSHKTERIDARRATSWTLSSVWSERFLDTEKASGSSPLGSTINPTPTGTDRILSARKRNTLALSRTPLRHRLYIVGRCIACLTAARSKAVRSNRGTSPLSEPTYPIGAHRNGDGIRIGLTRPWSRRTPSHPRPRTYQHAYHEPIGLNLGRTSHALACHSRRHGSCLGT
jgi:hypothetical protein